MVKILDKIISTFICESIGVSYLFGYISLNTWSIILAYDIWKTIRSNLLILPQCYKKYSIFSWIFSFIITVTVTIIDKKKLLTVRPMFGELNPEEKLLSPDCLSNNSNAYKYYLLPIAGSSIFLNGIFFVLTLRNIIEVTNNPNLRDGNAIRKSHIDR